MQTKKLNIYWRKMLPSQFHRGGHMAVSWVAVTIFRVMFPGISSAACRPPFLSWSFCGLGESFGDPDNTTWPMNSSFTALLFHTWWRDQIHTSESQLLLSWQWVMCMNLSNDSIQAAVKFLDPKWFLPFKTHQSSKSGLTLLKENMLWACGPLLRSVIWSKDDLEDEGYAAKSPAAFWTALLHWCRVQTLEPPSVRFYLHSYGLSGLLPIKNAAGLELWLQGVLPDGGSDWPTLTADDDIRVGTCDMTPKALLQCSQPSSATGSYICRSGVKSGFSPPPHLLYCPGSAAPQLRARRRESQPAGTQERNSNIWFLVCPVSVPCCRRDSF